MNIPFEQLAKAALALPADARAALADRLAESLDPLADEAFTAEWIAEARQRYDSVVSGRVKTIPANEALAQLRKGLT